MGSSVLGMAGSYLASVWFRLRLVCARRVGLIIINFGFALSATRLSLIRRERRQRDWHRVVFWSNLNRHFICIMSGWLSMAILTLSQTSCLRLLKCQFSLGKLYGGFVRPQWVMALLLQYRDYLLTEQNQTLKMESLSSLHMLCVWMWF